MHLPVLRRAINRERIGALIGGPLLIALGVLMDLAEFRWFQRKINLAPPPGFAIWIFRIFALALAAPGLWLLKRGLRPVAQHPLWKLMAERPQEVVSVKNVFTTEYRAYGATLNRQALIVASTYKRDGAKIETFAEWAGELIAELEAHVAAARK